MADLLHNKVLQSALLAWAIAQGLKVPLTLLTKRRWDFRRLVSPGGMPSSHSALVSAMATGVGRVKGFSAAETAMAFVIAFVVMYDSTGVRRAAGSQASVLNKIVDELFTDGRVREERLRELLGHTPIEVFIGAFLGIIVANLL